MFKPLFAGDVADMDHPFDAAAEIDESAEVGHVRDRAFDDAADCVLLSPLLPTDPRALASALRRFASRRD